MSKFMYPTSTEVPEVPCIAILASFVAPVAESATCASALQRFFLDRSLYALPIVDSAQRPVGLIERQAFVEYFGQPFTREIHGRKAVSSLKPPVLSHQPIVVDVATSVDDVAQIILSGGMEHMVSGFIVSRAGKYHGLANGHGLLNEITHRRQAELYALAHYDQLTGLPNRRLFLDRTRQSCLESKRTGVICAVMFIDVDRFKQINDNLGHAAGDHLLLGVANRLLQCSRDCDTVARLGGDEFGVVMEGLKQASDANLVASRIVDSMVEPITVMGNDLYVTVSIGIAIHPDDDTDLEGLLTKADAAMYEAKSHGRNGYRNYVAGFVPASLDSMSLEAELRNALINDELLLHYQPQMDFSSGIVKGVEALVRWRHPKRGLLSPVHFIPLAEQSRLIVDIGYWVLQAACEDHKTWMLAGIPPITVSVNVSTLQFKQHDFCENVAGIIELTGIDPACLELELTESIMMHNVGNAQDTLSRLKGIGLSLALDDFGTGFSSLSYLREFPIDRLKIDQSFIRAIENSESSESIVRAISALGKSLSMAVIAEGVESGAELEVVRRCNCDGVQGYLFSKPVASDVLIASLREGVWKIPVVSGLPD